eukprot:Unigene10197_Nuclearia_a/m.31136 Unigene10197_Nuclearia_a/g.31136  ORF Unigene10197_Nuclearia_a/g.31136 Unigene10197_Nuclearia_a/m.31136 type:complete len:811 (-) Unigene10197_Nuclearia_a:50-2482(-)
MEAVVAAKDDPLARLKRIFFGRLRSEVSMSAAPAQNGESAALVPAEPLVNEEQFAEVLLSVEGQKSLYSALDYFTAPAALENFKTAQGQPVSATKQYWFTALPQMLLFQLQRVRYSKESGKLVKIHSRLQFRKELVMDRYLESNRALVGKLRGDSERLNQECAQLEAQLDKYTHFLGRTVSVEDILHGAEAFFRLVPPAGDAVPLPNGRPLEHGGVQDADGAVVVSSAGAPGPMPQLGSQDAVVVPKLVEVLHAQAHLVTQRMRELQAEIKRLREEHKRMYDLPELSQHAYVLHAVLVHDGEAGMGHYWAFIRDPAADRWRRFNDTNVTDVTEETVFEESFGGKGAMSAYCLVYAQRNCLAQRTVDEALARLPAGLKAHVEKDNAAHEHEKSTWYERSTLSNQAAFSELPQSDGRPGTPVDATLADYEWDRIVVTENTEEWADERLRSWPNFFQTVAYANRLHQRAVSGVCTGPDDKPLPIWLRHPCKVDAVTLERGHKEFQFYAADVVSALRNQPLPGPQPISLLLSALGRAHQLEFYCESDIFKPKTLHVNLLLRLLRGNVLSALQKSLETIKSRRPTISSDLAMATVLIDHMLRAKMHPGVLSDAEFEMLQNVWIEAISALQEHGQLSPDDQKTSEKIVGLLADGASVEQSELSSRGEGRGLHKSYPAVLSAASISPLLHVQPAAPAAQAPALPPPPPAYDEAVTLPMTDPPRVDIDLSPAAMDDVTLIEADDVAAPMLQPSLADDATQPQDPTQPAQPAQPARAETPGDSHLMSFTVAPGPAVVTGGDSAPQATQTQADDGTAMEQ